MNAPVTPQNSGLAIASLVLGIIGMLVCGVGVLLGIPAVICGHMALPKIKRSGGAVTGSGMAIAGLVTGYVAIVFSLLLLPAILLPAISNALQTGKMTGTLNNGKQIFTAQFARSLDGVVTGKDSGWPKAVEFPTSTAFFTNLVGSGALKVDYSFFAASGITPYKGTDGNLFKAENNAWCVVADVGDQDPDQTPLLFTRNLRINSLAEAQPNRRVELSDDPPFGRRGVVVVYKGGAAILFRPEQLTSNFNLVGATNRVLRP